MVIGIVRSAVKFIPILCQAVHFICKSFTIRMRIISFWMINWLQNLQNAPIQILLIRFLFMVILNWNMCLRNEKRVLYRECVTHNTHFLILILSQIQRIYIKYKSWEKNYRFYLFRSIFFFKYIVMLNEFCGFFFKFIFFAILIFINSISFCLA